MQGGTEKWNIAYINVCINHGFIGLCEDKEIKLFVVFRFFVYIKYYCDVIHGQCLDFTILFRFLHCELTKNGVCENDEREVKFFQISKTFFGD